MAVMQNQGRIALARAVAAQPLYFAWGRGLPAWDTDPEAEPTNTTALVDEIGRRLVTAVQYVVPSAEGEIELPDGTRYTASAQESQWLHLRWTFDYQDAAGETVRELGIFIGGATAEGLPAGQRYFTADQVTAPGDLYTLERFDAFTRSASTRQVQEFVLPF